MSGFGTFCLQQWQFLFTWSSPAIIGQRDIVTNRLKTLNQQVLLSKTLRQGSSMTGLTDLRCAYPPQDCRQLLIEDFTAVSAYDGQDGTHTHLDSSLITELICQHGKHAPCATAIYWCAFLIWINIAPPRSRPLHPMRHVHACTA